MTTKALVLCAGLGTRLGELTAELPKPLLPLAGEPLLAYTLRHLARQGLRRVALNLHYRPELVQQAIGDGSRFGLELHYAVEDRLLGTAGAVANLAEYFDDAEQVLVVYGDLLFDQDLRGLFDLHRQRSAAATLLLHRRARSNSLVRLSDEGRIAEFLERPTEAQRARFLASLTDEAQGPWTNSGIQVLGRELIERIPQGRASDLPRDLYQPWLSELAIYGFPLTGYRCAIDSPERYAEAQAAVSTGRFRGLRAQEGRSGRRALLLDRDGVIIRDLDLLVREEDVELLPGVPAAIQRAQRAGYVVVVVTNQTVVARGLASEDQVAAVNRRVDDLLQRAGCAPLHQFYVCPHHPQADLDRYRQNCPCRKPRPGMLLRAAEELGFQLGASVLVGDRLSDILAGARAGCHTVLVQTGKHEAPAIVSPDEPEEVRPDRVCRDLSQAVDLMLEPDR